MNRQSSLPSIFNRTNSSVSLQSSSQTQTNQRTNILKQIGHQERKWLNKHGKSSSVIFSQKMLSRLREYFDDLDWDKSGSIGVEELEEPLITLQFCQNRQQVQKMINTIDLDGSGEVQFGEFLEIFRKIKLSKYSNDSEAKRLNTFAKIFSTENKGSLQTDIHYKLALSELRRKKMLQDLTTNLPVKQYSTEKKIPHFNFLDKIKEQFSEYPERRQRIKGYRKTSYQKMKLGVSIRNNTES